MGYVIETVGVLPSMINIFNSQPTKELMQIWNRSTTEFEKLLFVYGVYVTLD